MQGLRYPPGDAIVAPPDTVGGGLQAFGPTFDVTCAQIPAMSDADTHTPTSPHTRTRQDLAHLIQAVATEADRAAFAALFDHFAPRIKTMMMRSGANAGTAEELAQETLLTVWRKAAYFNPAGASPAGWVFTIARNLRIDRLRHERPLAPLALDEPDETADPDEAGQPDQAFELDERERRLRKAMTQLSADQLRVVELSFFEDKAHGEIASLLDLPLGTVKSRLRLAMGRLRKLLVDLT
jgi:RNA polymerase sigma-70 factor (ECF subfamily)